MDPITMAIVAAVAAGATKVSESLIPDAYNALKAALQKRFGTDSKLVQAVNELEAEPDFEPHQIALAGRVAQSKADQDHELVKLAQDLLQKLEGKGRDTSGGVHQQAGDNAIQIGHNLNGGIHIQR